MSEISLPQTIGTPKNPVPVLQQRVQLLEDENKILLQKLQVARKKLAEIQGQDPQQAFDELIAELQKAEADRLARERAAEETDPAEGSESSSSDDKNNKKEKLKRKGHGPRPQLRLRRVEKIHELSAEDRQCTACGGELVPLGEQFEEYEEVTVLEREYVLRTVRCRKYRCSCNGCVRTAPAPVRLVSGGRYDQNFAVQVAIDKYLDHTPLERQVRIMDRLGLEITSQTLFDQLDVLVQRITPIYDALELRALQSPILHADETRWPLLNASRGSPWFVWARCTPDIAHYTILGSKSAKAARGLFSGYSGIVVADGYAVYEKLAHEGSGFRLANCWAHALRKFRDIRENFPTPCRKILGWLGELYRIEAEVPGPFPGDEAAQELRLRLRNEKSRLVLAQIRDWACTEVGLPKSELGKAVRYMLKRWDGLTMFVENPLIPLDNNAAERSLRGPVVGRKVHYGSKSKRGTQVAAVLYSVLETAKLCGVDPAGYLKAAVEQVLIEPNAVLLPHDFSG